ncbi:lysylphosphatidylglycerol synthase domain-containing protein [Entomobacter blattae]|uniref:Lysylphosphatidylglycerol synthase TM region n=1 Tax=Entomobacter blattae TaxID=2762277 RepID=A0A7H1NRX7_9PROT|nr:lysylphosphatidylglycerol synthase domain-containing protein [Entomobacter blattae]QNT78537.1 Lysylphosphatidylglycerol synthase TM region [Entomobacter blattae]
MKPVTASSKGSGWQKYLRFASHGVGLLLMIGALYVVQGQFRELRISDIKNALHNIPCFTLLLSIGFTFLSYFILSFYDRLATLQIGCRLPFHRTAFAAFCSYVLSHNLGFSAISGAAVRFRLYGSWGVKPFAIAQIIAFCSTTYLLGAMALIGTVFILEPAEVPILGQKMSVPVLQAIGGIAWVLTLSYVALSARLKELAIGKYKITLPSPQLAICQVIVSAADVAATAGIAYILIPPSAGLGYGSFLAIYIAAYTAGLISSVPAGIGVFESTMVMALSPYMTTSYILSIILVFRLFYYVIPLFVAGGMFALHEVFSRKVAKKTIAEESLGEESLAGHRAISSRNAIRESEAELSVAVSMVASFLCGIGVLVTIFVAYPLWRLDLTATMKTAIDNALFVAAAGLIGVSIGLAHRVVLAWYLEIALLVSSFILCWLRGSSWLALLFIGLTFLLILPFRGAYYRKAKMLNASHRYSVLLSLGVLGLAGLLLWWINHDYIHAENWHDVLVSTSFPLGVKGAVGAAFLLGLLMLYGLVTPGVVTVAPWTQKTAEYYHSFPAKCSDLAKIKPDGVVMSKSKETALPFLREEGFIIGMGDPVGKESDTMETIRYLRDLAEQEGRRVVFWNVRETWLDLYKDLSLYPYQIKQLQDCNNAYICCQAEEKFLIGILLKKRYVNSLSR